MADAQGPHGHLGLNADCGHHKAHVTGSAHPPGSVQNADAELQGWAQETSYWYQLSDSLLHDLECGAASASACTNQSVDLPHCLACDIASN